MKRPAICLLLFSFPAAAQFEAASIKPSSGTLRINHEPTRLTLHSLMLPNLLLMAHGLSQWWQLDFRVEPDHGKFDIDAVWSDKDLQNKWPEILKELLVARFNINERVEVRPTYVYSLVVDKNRPGRCLASKEDKAAV